MNIKVKTEKPFGKKAREAKRKISEQKRAEMLSYAQSIEKIPLPPFLKELVDDPNNDLHLIGSPEYVEFLINVLATRLATASWKRTLEMFSAPGTDTKCCYYIVHLPRHKSKTYRRIFDLIEETIVEARKALMFESMAALAMGEAEYKKGFIPPDVKAQELFLQGHDDRYKPNAQPTAPQVVLNIGGGIL